MSSIVKEIKYDNGNMLVAQECNHVIWNSQKNEKQDFSGYEVMYLEKDSYEGDNCYNVVSSEYFLTEEEAILAFDLRAAGNPASWSETFPKSIKELLEA